MNTTNITARIIKWLFRRSFSDQSYGISDDISYSNIVPASIMCIVNVILLGLVIWLLFVLLKNQGKTVGLLLSLHLCSAEICIAMLSLSIILTSTLSKDDSTVSESILRFLVASVALLFTTSLYCIKLLLLFLKVLKVYLGLRYNGQVV